MQRRAVWGVLIGVAAAHWWVIFGPWDVDGPSWEAAAPQRLETVWVHMVTEPVPALPRPEVPERPTPPSKKAITPQSIETPVPLYHAESLPLSEAVDRGAVTVDAVSESPVLDENFRPVEGTLSAPHLQVHDAAGMPVLWNITSEAIAATQHQLLRFKVHGFVKGMEYHAKAEISWSIDGTEYQARQSISAFLLGSMEQTSQGIWSVQGLQPLEFTDRRFTKTRAVQFDWERGQALFTPERPAAAIGTGAQDRLSVFLQLAAMLQAMPQLRVAGTHIDIPTLGSRSLQMWTFVVEGDETVEVPAGHLPTLRLRRQSQVGEDEKALLWVNPERGYMPARIHLEEHNGDVMDFVLKS